MTRGPGFLPHLVEFAVEYGLPVSDNDWENVVGPLYHRLSLKANKWNNIQRYWVDNLQHSSDGCRKIRDILLRKKNGLPFTHPCSRIIYNDNATPSATAIQGLQETIQGLRETIQDLQQQLAISNGANANVTMAVPTTDALTNDYEEEESQERDLAAYPSATPTTTKSMKALSPMQPLKLRIAIIEHAATTRMKVSVNGTFMICTHRYPNAKLRNYIPRMLPTGESGICRLSASQSKLLSLWVKANLAKFIALVDLSVTELSHSRCSPRMKIH